MVAVSFHPDERKSRMSTFANVATSPKIATAFCSLAAHTAPSLAERSNGAEQISKTQASKYCAV